MSAALNRLFAENENKRDLASAMLTVHLRSDSHTGVMEPDCADCVRLAADLGIDIARPVHLHRPTSPAPVCGAPVPSNRERDLTAWRSDVTCRRCLATLREV